MLLVVILLPLIKYVHTKVKIDFAPVVYTNNGPVRGTIEYSINNIPYHAYRGIPYAQPPIHDRRFEPPEPIPEWQEILDTTNYGPVCPQAADLGYENMSEDCLTLNIFTRGGSNNNVFIVVNGEGFNEGAAMDVGPDYFMDNECVLVTLNYRMNIFGFISTGTRHAAGNVGLKDQVLAFEWITGNIASFGGNPYTATLMGHSAGAMAATLHFISPIGVGYFQRVILMSGSAITHYPLQRNNLALVTRQAKMVGCVTDDISLLIKCLKRVDFRKLAGSYRNLTDWGPFPYKTWFPVIERYFGQKRFLEEDPIYLYRKRQNMEIPFLIGVTRDEMSFMADKILSNESLLKDFKTNFTDVAPICFLYEKGTQRSKNISEKMWQKFFIDGVTKNSLETVFKDSHIRYGVHRIINLLTSYQDLSIHVYRSSIRGRFGHDLTSSRISHGDDLQFLFPLRRFNVSYTPTDPEFTQVVSYVKMWLSFGQTGYPKPLNENISWPKYNKSHHLYMDIGQQLELRTDFPKETIQFWEELFPFDPIYSKFEYRHPRFWTLMVLIGVGFVFVFTVMGLTARLFYVKRQRAQGPRNSQGEQNQIFEMERIPT